MNVERRTLLSLGAVGVVLASMNGRAAAANGPQLAQPPVPNLLLLLDTSGSMEDWTNGDTDPPAAACTPDQGNDSVTGNGTCFTAAYPSGAPTVSAQNKWGAVMQALSGSAIQSPGDLPPSGGGPYFRWYEMKRAVGSDFDNEYRLNLTHQAEDVPYSLNYHRVATWDQQANSGKGAFCLLSPGFLPSSILPPAGSGVGLPVPAFSTDAVDSFPANTMIGLTPGAIASAHGKVSNAATGPISDCTFALNNDGNIDAVRDLVRFGLMTFDNDPSALTGVTVVGTTLQPFPSAGIWSYFPGWNLTAAPTPGWIDPNTTLPLTDCAAAPYDPVGPLWYSQGSASQACMPLLPYEVGARNPAAPPWGGRMVPFPDGRAGLGEQEANNDIVKMVINGVRPYGATPIAGMFTDARNYFRLDPNGPEASDPYVNSNYTGGHGCRPQYIILLTDGGANLDLRPTCKPGTETCPFQTPDEIAQDLCWGGPSVGMGTSCTGSSTYEGVTTYVIGFSSQPFNLPGETTPPPQSCQQQLAAYTSSTLCTAPTFCDSTSNPPPAGSAAASCCTLLKVACAGSAGQTPPFFADSASDLDGAFAAILSKVSRQASSHVVPVFATANAGVTFASEYFTASYTTLPESAGGNSTNAPWAGTITESKVTCPSYTGTPTFPSARGSTGNAFLVVKNTSGLATTDGGTIRPWLTPPSLNDGLVNTAAQAAQEDWGGLGQLSTTTDLQVTSFSCPADPASGARLSADGCAAYTSAFYTGSGSASLTVALPGPSGSLSYASGTSNLAARATNWLGPVIDSTPAYVSAPSLALSDNTYRAFAQAYATRPNVLYVETTDGALHALSPDSGVTPSLPGLPTLPGSNVTEFWTFLPPALNSQIVNNIPAADKVLLDASPIVADTVFSRTMSSGTTASPFDWHTTLVSSFAAGGRGFFALDVTQPYSGTSTPSSAAPGTYPAGLQTNPHFLWQITNSGVSGATVQAFGSHGATPAITTLYVQALGGLLAETGVAILPGGSDGQAPTGTCTRETTQDPPLTAMTTPWKPRTLVRSWGTALAGATATSPCASGTPFFKSPNGRTVSVVRLSDGAVLATFLNAVDDTNTQIGSGGKSARIHTTFDSPMTGTPVVYPTGGGRIATAAYVSDADGIIWKLNLSSTDPTQWTGTYFFDSFNQGVTSGVALAAGLTSSDQVAGNLGQQLTAAPILSIGPDSSLVLNFATGDQTSFTSKTFRAGSNDTPADEIPIQNYVWSVSDYQLSGVALPHWFVPFVDGTTTEYNVNPATNSPSPHYNYGERVTGPMAVYDGVLYFATYWPDDYALSGGGACQLGEARIYGLDYFSAQAPQGSCSGGTGSIGCGGVPRLVPNPPPTPPSGLPQYIVPAATNSAIAGSLIPGVSITQAQPCLAQTTTTPDTYFGSTTPSFQATTAAAQPTLTYVATANSTSGSSLNNTAAKQLTQPIPQPQRNTKIDSWAQVIN